jgi:phenylalanyl-tRNA synthetase beta chain
MKVSLNWLRELVELPPTVDELVTLLTMAGVEVERIATTGCEIPNIIVAEIKSSEQHANADRLSVCEVDDGSGVARQIVCGAKNYKVGDKVPLALPGAQLAPDFVIKVGKLRGVESQGMMCSAKELKLAEDAEGLLILPPEAKIGTPIGELFPRDTVLDLEITPNRPDLLSMNGIAREIGALTGRPAKLVEPKSEPQFLDESAMSVTAAECPVYTARKISGVKISSSPRWLRTRLEAAGLRPINNVVDITNYVMLELGQPLHAFDAAKLDGALNVRFARQGEEFLALDGKTYTLATNHLVIADAARAVALAGVMGGEATGVVEKTSEIWLESAYFLSQSVRRTARQLGLASDSSYRFERRVDQVSVPIASQRAAELIVELCGGEMHPIECGLSAKPFKTVAVVITRKGNEETRRVLPTSGQSYFRAHAMGRPVVHVRPERVRQLLGVEVTEDRIGQILRGFGLESFETPATPSLAPTPAGVELDAKMRAAVEAGQANMEQMLASIAETYKPGSWQIPTFRPDLTREVDLIEEIARVIGMDVIPARVQARFAGVSATDRAYDRAMALRRACVAQGLHEARGLTLVPEEPRGADFTQAAPALLQRVKNPMIDDQVVLRPNLMHGLLEAVARNIRAGVKSIRLFEIGRTFSTVQPEEFSHAAIVISGPADERSWRNGEARDADLFDLKGIVTAALGSETTFEPEKNSALALSISVNFAGECVGFAGQLWPADARAVDAPAPVLFAEMDLDALAAAELKRAANKYRDVPRFPAMTRDIALLASIELTHAKIENTLRAANEPLLTNIELFDVFTDPSGTRVPVDKKSLAYSLTYRANDRTLTADEVNAAHSRLKLRLPSELAVTLRE